MFGVGVTGLADGAFLYHLRGNLALLAVGTLCAGPGLREGLVRLSGKRPVVSAAALALLFVVSVASLVHGSYNPFLYFHSRLRHRELCSFSSASG